MRLRINYLMVFLAFALLSCNKPIANFLIEAEESQAPATIKFANQSEKADMYEWDFGDGETSNVADPEHKYYLSGNYNVKLKAKKGNKTSTMTKDIKITAPDKCLVEIETNYGSMTVHLYDETPKHRDNFLELAEEGFYDGLIFHRVIQGFMIQGGDPSSRDAGQEARLGSGGPGYKIPAEFNDQLHHIKGALAAARMGDQVNPAKESSGSQFYIVQGKPQSEQGLSRVEMQKRISYDKNTRRIYQELGGTPFLDQEYTVFGRVISGLEVIDKIAAAKTAPGDRPVEDIKMKIKLIK